MQEPKQSPRTVSRWLLWISVAAFLLRLVYIWLNQRPLASDELGYQALAENLVAHGSYTLDSLPTAFRPVGYPAIAALVYALFGVKPVALKIVQALFDSAMIFVLPRIPGEIGAKARLMIACAWAVFPPAILYTNLVMSESLFGTLLIVGCFVFLHNAAGKWGPVLLGIVFGVLTLIRPVALLLFVVLMIFNSLASRTRQQVIVASAVFLVVLAPWILRNWIVMGEPTIASNTGITLLIGNNPNANGGFNARFPLEGLDTAGTEIAVERQALGLATSYIREHPEQFVVNAFKKYAQFFSSESYLLVAQFSPEALESPIPLAKRYAAISPVAFLVVNGAYVLVLVAGWLGFLSSRRNRLWDFMASLMFAFLFVHLIVFGGNRFHYPFMPFFLLYGVQYLVAPRDKFPELGTGRKIAAVLGILSVVSVWGTEIAILFRQ